MKRNTYNKVFSIHEVENGYLVEMSNRLGECGERYVFTTYDDFIEFMTDIGTENGLL